jgi:hypothetical protein
MYQRLSAEFARDFLCVAAHHRASWQAALSGI